jgi:hypothetical protein
MSEHADGTCGPWLNVPTDSSIAALGYSGDGVWTLQLLPQLLRLVKILGKHPLDESV